jgi:8-oxo-dGTP pyrophosphatase MutT (NUDIX family)
VLHNSSFIRLPLGAPPAQELVVDTDTFWNNLPRKAVGVGCLFFDTDGHVLIVKPTYKPPWQIPGGVVEAGESPREACIREVYEELGLHVTPTRLLCVDYVSPANHGRESLQFIFLGGMLSAEHIANITLPPAELSEYQFLPSAAALPLFSEHSHRRVACCLEHLGMDRTLYLENQEEPWS